MPRPKFTEWPVANLREDQVVRMYGAGFAGCIDDPEAEVRLRESVTAHGGFPDARDALAQYGLAGSYEGKLVTPFQSILRLYPGSLPGPGQQRGDCVSHSTKNACLLTMCCEVEGNRPDDETGKIEEAPEVSPEGIKNGVLSTGAIYWYRGYDSDGWSCQAAARVATEEAAAWVRKDYPELGIDLTVYSGRLAGKYGRRSPPSEITRHGQKHLIRTATSIRSFDELRDLLGNGYGVSGCGGEGWSNRRDANGFSTRSGSWSHAMAVIAADDRDEIKKEYGGPLICIQNSWGKFNSGSRRILGTDIDIPEGSFWAKWSACKRRYHVAFSSLSGWPRRKLPDYKTGIL